MIIICLTFLSILFSILFVVAIDVDLLLPSKTTAKPLVRIPFLAPFAFRNGNSPGMGHSFLKKGIGFPLENGFLCGFIFGSLCPASFR